VTGRWRVSSQQAYSNLNGNETKHSVLYQLDFVVQNDTVFHGGTLANNKMTESLESTLKRDSHV
jgi:hypothetical protein